MSDTSVISSRRWALLNPIRFRDQWRKTEHARTVAMVMLGLIVLWEMLVHVLKVKAFMLPPPSIVFSDIVSYPAFFFAQSLVHDLYYAGGFLLALVGGVALAIAIVSSQVLDKTFYTLLVATNAIPKVALAPLFVDLARYRQRAETRDRGYYRDLPDRDQHHASACARSTMT